MHTCPFSFILLFMIVATLRARRCGTELMFLVGFSCPSPYRPTTRPLHIRYFVLSSASECIVPHCAKRGVRFDVAISRYPFSALSLLFSFCCDIWS